jgi:anhydro-N-acetylmuramic acid kinase
MIIDALIERWTRGRERFDRDARMALRGKTLPLLLDRLLRDPYLDQKPPKTAGREQFGRKYARRIIEWGHAHRSRHQDLLRTATVFTSLSIARALRQFVFPRIKVKELIAAGGGTRNPLIMAQLAAGLPEVTIRDAEEFGVPAESKEAFAFAVLAYEAFHGRSNHLPSATGARQPAVLGKFVRGRAR